jgi:peptidoglycan/LPS O-acetylase OafA/YrhL
MTRYFPWLDPLRFGSALSVAFFHQMFWSWAQLALGATKGFEQFVATDVQFPSSAPFVWFGWVGVEVFFVISGFVIANSASKSSPVEFLISRALRLYPAVWVCATATFIVLLIFANEPSYELFIPYVKSMLLTPIWGTYWIDGVYWTLATEIVFYAIVFCVLLTNKFTFRHVAWVLTVYSAVYNAFALLVVSGVVRSERLYYIILSIRVDKAVLLLAHGCYFALGIWLFISANRKLTTPERFAVIVTLLSGSAEIFSFSSFLLTHIPAISGQSPLIPIAVWLAASLVIGIAANRSRRSIGPSISPRSAGVLRTLGLITFPLYLTHNIIGSAIVRTLINLGVDAVVAVWLAMSIVVAFSWIICSKIEPAIRVPLKKLFLYFGAPPKKTASLWKVVS